MRTRSVMSVACIACMAVLAAPGSASAFGVLSSFGLGGSAAGQISLPEGIETTAGGLVYVADLGNSRIDVFTTEGAFARAFGKGVNPNGGDVCTTATGCKAGLASNAAAGLYYPADVAVDGIGNAYVADYENNRIDVFSSDGTFVQAFGRNVGSQGSTCTTQTGCQRGAVGGTAGTVSGPVGVTVKNGTLYVSDAYESNRIDVFSTGGTFLRAFGRGVNPQGGNVCTAETGCQNSKEVEAAGGISAPIGTAIEANEQMVIADNHNHRVDIFDTSGNFIRAFGWGVNPTGSTTQLEVCTAQTGCRKGTEGIGAGALPYPAGIALDAAGHLLIADTTNRRVNEFTVEGTFLRAFGEGVIDGKAQFEVCTTETGCQKGIEASEPGSLPTTIGVATDCTGAIYATSFEYSGLLRRVTRFGEPGIGFPPCAAPAPPPSPSRSGTEGFSAASLGPVTARPIIEIEINKQKGTAYLIATVSDPGTLTVQGKGVLAAHQQTKKPGLVELLIAPNRALKRKLQRKHKARVTLSIDFRADNGASDQQAMPITLKMAHHRARGH